MPMTVKVGLAKKIGQPEFGSLGASCDIELELDGGLLFNDLEGLQQKIQSAYVACRQAVNDELAGRCRIEQSPRSDAAMGTNGHCQPPSNGNQQRIPKGNGSNQLDQPWGIFVDTNFDLYVADAINHRIQRFSRGEANGTTVAGQGIPNGLLLRFPTDVILDGNNQIYIADNQHNRIVRVRSTDYECLVGCSGSPGPRADQLASPYSLRFDSDGNLFVADEWNHRIQKFFLESNSLPTMMTTSEPFRPEFRQ